MKLSQHLLRPVPPVPVYKHAPATGQRRRIVSECKLGDFILDGEVTPNQPRAEEGWKFESRSWMSNGVRTVPAWTRTA